MKKLILCALLLGCEAPIEPVASEEDAITNANPTSGAAYAVRISTPAGGCSAVSLSKHWLITAAHCYAGLPGNSTITVRRGTYPASMITAYAGDVDVYIHPKYDQGATSSDDGAAWDLALVRLRGNGLDSFTSAQIYSGPETPWTSRGSQVDAIGYGWGSDAGGRTECTNDDNLVFGVKRRAHFAFTGDGELGWEGVDLYSTLRAVCHGDSGGPWVVVRNSADYLVALASRGYQKSDTSNRGPHIEPKMDWIQDIANFITPRLSCPVKRDHRYAQEVDFRVCTEL